MNPSDLYEMYNKFDIVANELRGKLIDDRIDDFLHMLDHAEMKIGIENILSEIDDNEIILSKSSYDTLMCAVEYCKIDEIYYNDIKYKKE